MDECLAGTVVEVADEAATLGAVLEPLDDLVPSVGEHGVVVFYGYRFWLVVVYLVRLCCFRCCWAVGFFHHELLLLHKLRRVLLLLLLHMTP